MKIMKLYDIKKTFLAMMFLMWGSFVSADIIKNQTEFLPPDKAFQPSIKIVGDNHLEINWDIEKGYYLNDKVLRFAKVVVGE